MFTLKLPSDFFLTTVHMECIFSVCFTEKNIIYIIPFDITILNSLVWLMDFFFNWNL